jgi:hypothetical protein
MIGCFKEVQRGAFERQVNVNLKGTCTIQAV